MNKNYKKALIFVSLLSVAGISSYFYFKAPQKEIIDYSGILDFKDSRDTQFILDIFERDWHWLISEFSPDYDPNYTLQYRASSQDPAHKGNLTIKVGYDGDKPTGFVAYHKKNFYHGRLLFLDVVPEYRSKNWGYKLARYALEDMKQRGATKISLLTRTTNYPAQKLYKRLGFKEVRRDGGFVDFEYTA